MKLRELIPGARRKPKKRPRPDAPRTIVPEPAVAPDRFDAARARLREQIPPRGDED